MKLAIVFIVFGNQINRPFFIPKRVALLALFG
jgi:hypothetical protein